MKALLLKRPAAMLPSLADLLRLTKPRLEILVVFAAAAGFCLANRAGIDWGQLCFLLLGMALVSGAAGTLNQVLETCQDGQMARTCARPLPSGRVGRRVALLLGIGLAVSGIACLALKTTPLAACFAGAGLTLYLGVYTPMKRHTPYCIVPGAIAGALPPVVGWAAVDGSLARETALLFGILFTWQMPHLLSIAWLHREEYARARFEMLQGEDGSGRATAKKILLLSALLALLTLIRTAGMVYFCGALLLNGCLLACAVQFLRNRDRESARRLFLASIVYLPLLLTLMMFAFSHSGSR